MKNILIALLVIVIIGQSFSLHRCRCEAAYEYFLKGKVQMSIKTKNTQITSEKPLNAYDRIGKRKFSYDSLSIKLNP